MSKITASVVKKMHKLWEVYTDFGYNLEPEEQAKKDKAHEEYIAFKRENFDNATEIADAAVMELVSDEDRIHLPSVNKMSLTAFSLIGKSDLHEIELDGFTELTEKQLDALSGLRNRSKKWRSRDFSFDSLTKIPDGFYGFFGTGFKVGGDMSLNGITELTEGEEKALAKIKFSSLQLRNLKKVTPKGLTRFGGWLILGVEELHLEVAQGMASWKCGALTLTKVENITTDVAYELVKMEADCLQFGTGYFHNPQNNFYWECAEPDGVRTLSKEVATVFAAKRYWKLGFYGLTEMDVEVATALNKMKGCIELYNFDASKASVDVVQALLTKNEGADSINAKDCYLNRKESKIEPRL